MRNKLLLSLLSALLLSVGWLGGSGLTLPVALVPLLFISVRYDASRRSFWRMFGWTALAFGLWSGATTWWIWYAAPIGAILSVAITIVLMGGVFMLYHYVSKRSRPALAYVLLAGGWIAAEYLYTVGQVSFPWLTLGNGLANDPRAVQWYEYTGVFGGSLWILVCNLLFFHALLVRCRATFITAVLFVLVPLGYSLIRYRTVPAGNGQSVDVTVVQPNIDPYNMKFTAGQTVQNELLLSLAAQAPAGTEFIVMPETAIDDYLWEDRLENSASIRLFRESVAERYPEAQLIVGATTGRMYRGNVPHPPTARWSDGYGCWLDHYNSALAIDTAAAMQVHHKSKLVVGVEKMPWPKLTKYLDFLIVDLGGTTGQLGYDTVRQVFRHATGTEVGTAICYESIYGQYFGEFVQGGAQFMAVITNDGWWRDTPGYRQHFSYSRLRAIETRRAVARSANTGISGFINDRGDVLSMLGWEERGILSATLPLNDSITFYVRYGDYIGRIAGYVFVLSLLYYVAYRYRRRSHLVD